MAPVPTASKRHNSTCTPCVSNTSRSKALPTCGQYGNRPKVTDRTQSCWAGRPTTSNEPPVMPSLTSVSSQPAPDIFSDFDWLGATNDASLNNMNEGLDWNQLIAPLDTTTLPQLSQKTTEDFRSQSRRNDSAIITSPLDNFQNPFEGDTTMFDASSENMFDTQPDGFDAGFDSGFFSENSSSTDECPDLGAKNCLTTALGFMMQTSPTAPSGCALTENDKLLGSQASAYKDPSSKSVISENRYIIESLQNILDCPCSHEDDYLLALVALNTLKVISWYAKIARSSSSKDTKSQRTPSSTSKRHRGSVDLDRHRSGNTSSRSGHDQSGVAAQTVLSELHRVRRLVYNWSKRVSGLCNSSKSRASSSGSFAGSGNGNQIGNPASGLGNIPPLSGHSFDQLQDDLWAALSAVSADTIETLRRRST